MSDQEMSPAERVERVALQLRSVEIGLSGWQSGGLPGLLREFVTELTDAAGEIEAEMAALRAEVRQETAREIAQGEGS